MTKAKHKLKIFGSLKVKFLAALLIGLCVATAVFFGIRSGFDYYINHTYLSAENKKAREEDYLSDLQDYVNSNYTADDALNSTETKLFSQWSKSQKYVYLMVYKDDQLFYSSDMEEEEPEGEGDGEELLPPSNNEGEKPDGTEGADEEKEHPTTPGSGLVGSYPTYEELKEYAEKNGTKLITLGEDGAVFASVAEFSEYLYYDLSNVIGLISAIALFSALMLLFFTRIMVRITRLASDVNRVSAGELNYSISAVGTDEISRLSGNVENMRSTILENLAREREAREANTELITSMSHDIRTPLTVLLGYLDVMKQNASDKSMEEYVLASEATAMRLKKLSDDMFNYFLVFGNEQKAELLEYEASTLFSQMLDEHILLLSETNLSIERKEQGDISGTKIVTDAPKLMRIIDNVFSNLCKYSDENEPIKINLSQEENFIVIEFKNRIKKSSDDVESNGIGLKSCKKLAGQIGVEFECGASGEYYSSVLKIRTK